MRQPLTDELIYGTLGLVLLVVVFFVGAFIYAIHVKKKHDRERAEWGITDDQHSETDPTITKMAMHSAYGGGSVRGIGVECPEDSIMKLRSLRVSDGNTSGNLSHVFGQYDAYAAPYNNGFEPIPNSEIEFTEIKNGKGLPQEKGMMWRGGKAVANDIEMVLLVFDGKSQQYFVPCGDLQKLSQAIKQDMVYINKETNVKYKWNGIQMVEVGA